MTGTGTALTRAAKLLALDLADALVGQAPGAGTAGTAGLDGVGAEEVRQPLQVAVADEGVLGQVPAPGTAGDPPLGTACDHQLQSRLPAVMFPPEGTRLPGHRSQRGHSQGLDGPQGGEGALGQALDLVVIEREQ